MLRYRIIASGILLAVLALPALSQEGSGRPKAGAAGLLHKGDPLAGKLKSEDERCQECHGHDGNAQDIEDGVGNIGKYPRLAGQLPSYILKQMRDFRNGVRSNDTMLVMARSVSDKDVADIAAYFSGQKIANEKANVLPQGHRLFAEGDGARGIPACAGCHGEAGQGIQQGDVIYPRLSGQHQRYLAKQLTEWRLAERKNSLGGIMNEIAKKLTDSDIEQLSSYLSGL